MIRSLPLCIAFALGATANAQSPAESAANDPTIPLTWIGSNARVSLGINDDGDVLGEILAILGKDDDSAWLGEIWLGQGGAGGVQVGYNFLRGAPDSDKASVWKVFAAADQNAFKDRKASVGIGWERDDLFFSGYFSHATSGTRLVNTTLTSNTTTLTGTDANGDPFKPTEAKQYEVGVKYQPPGINASVTLAAFNITQKNSLSTDPNNEIYQVAVGEIRSRGLELEAGRVAGVVTERGTIRTRTAVLSAGAWASSFCHQYGVTFPQATVRQTALAVAPGPEPMPDALHTREVSITRRGDGGHTLHEVHHRTLRQTLAEPQVLARVDAGIRFSGQLATLAGAIGGGAMATATGARTALAMAAAMLAAAALLAALRLRD